MMGNGTHKISISAIDQPVQNKLSRY